MGLAGSVILGSLQSGCDDLSQAWDILANLRLRAGGKREHRHNDVAQSKGRTTLLDESTGHRLMEK
jgi:hypothetical protein